MVAVAPRRNATSHSLFGPGSAFRLVIAKLSFRRRSPKSSRAAHCLRRRPNHEPQVLPTKVLIRTQAKRRRTGAAIFERLPGLRRLEHPPFAFAPAMLDPQGGNRSIILRDVYVFFVRGKFNGRPLKSTMPHVRLYVAPVRNLLLIARFNSEGVRTSRFGYGILRTGRHLRFKDDGRGRRGVTASFDEETMR